METARIVFQCKFYCSNCNEENISVLDKDVVNVEYFKTVKCYCCGREYKTKLSILTDGEIEHV